MMKTPIVPFLIGGMTVFGVWMAYTNRKALDKLINCVSGQTEQAIQKFKEKMESSNCECQNANCGE